MVAESIEPSPLYAGTSYRGSSLPISSNLRSRINHLGCCF
jgi:hypothetical protein